MALSRRKLLLATAAALAPLGVSQRAKANALGTRFGAIRWDAWYYNTAGSTGYYAQAALGPQRYQFRAPWFAVVNSVNSVTINGNSQAIMDAEISYAQAAGIKYWAYNWYPAANTLMNGWKLHQSSTHKADVNWCICTPYAQFVSDVTAGNHVAWFQQSNYEKVTATTPNRPLVYLLGDSTSLATLTTSISTLRSACSTAGLGNPYIVVLNFSAATGASVKTTIGADAVSAYNYSPAYTATQTYATLDSQAQAFWTACATAGTTIVPICVTGHDRRPRIEQPSASEVAQAPSLTGQHPFIGMRQYTATATTSEIATHLSACLTWMGANAAAVPANTALIYAWNEFDEGGWLCPTYTISGPDHSRLDAIASVIS